MQSVLMSYRLCRPAVRECEFGHLVEIGEEECEEGHRNACYSYLAG